MNLDTVTLRDATAADLPAINDIYNYYVETCTCTWQMEKDTPADRQAWFQAHAGKYPVIVAEAGGAVIGWASLSPFHVRCGYRHTMENSIYLRNDMKGKGLGKKLLEELIRRAPACGCHSIVAVISADQVASIALHERTGFTMAGRLREAGNKFGKWLDVVYMQRMI